MPLYTMNKNNGNTSGQPASTLESCPCTNTCFLNCAKQLYTADNNLIPNISVLMKSWILVTALRTGGSFLLTGPLLLLITVPSYTQFH